MKTKGKHIWAILIVAGMIMFSGCCGLFGGGGNPTTTLTGGGGSEVTTTTGGGSHATTTQASGGGGGGGGISLDNLLNLGKPTGYSVTYEIKAAGQTMTQAHYFSGQKFRMDTALTVEGFSVEARFYKNADGSYICNKMGGAWSCNANTEETPTGETGQTTDLDDFMSELKSGTSVPTYEGTRLIAGVLAQCFKSDVGGTSMRYCLHPNYKVPLFFESADLVEGQEGYFSMMATSFSANTPAESTFTLPAKATDPSDPCAVCGMMPADYQAACLANCNA
jgi:hypothetical protein